MSEYFDEDKLNFGVYWESVSSELSKSFNLNRGDYNNLIEFGRLLGSTDVEGQLSHINMYKGIFTTERDEFQKDCKTKSKLYRVLGFFVGAVLALLII